MSQFHSIVLEQDDTLRAEVLEGLRRFNEEAAGPYNIQHVRLAMRADDGSLIAGLVGLCYWNMVHVDLLWVAPEHRRSGCGRALLRRAEEFALEHGCDVVYLATYSFQAPGVLPEARLRGVGRIGERTGWIFYHMVLKTSVALMPFKAQRRQFAQLRPIRETEVTAPTSDTSSLRTSCRSSKGPCSRSCP